MKQNTRLALLIAVLGLMCFVLSACGTTGHVAMMHDFNGQVKGDNPAAVFEVAYPFGDRYSCSYLHISHWSSGQPFNDRYEETMDMIGCSVRVWGR